jgi:hypothetical protein
MVYEAALSFETCSPRNAFPHRLLKGHRREKKKIPEIPLTGWKQKAKNARMAFCWRAEYVMY